MADEQSKVLSYPLINPPIEAGLSACMLYFDQVSILITGDIQRSGREIAEKTYRFIDAGLLSPIKLDSMGAWANIQTSLVEFLEQNPHIVGHYRAEFQSGNTERIHSSKLAYTAWKELKRMGVWERSSSSWFEVSASLADLIMSGFVTHLADQDGFIPLCQPDQVGWNKAVSCEQLVVAARARDYTRRLFRDVFRVPVVSDPERLRRFKDDHTELRSSFNKELRRAVRKFQEEAPEAWDDLFIEIEASVKSKAAQIEAELEAASLTSSSNLDDRLSIAASTFSATGQIATGNVLGFAADAINAARDFFSRRDRNLRRDRLLNDPLAYMVLANRDLRNFTF